MDNLNETNKAINISMSVRKVVQGLMGTSEDAAREKEEACSLALQLGTQVETLKYISDQIYAKRTAAHGK